MLERFIAIWFYFHMLCKISLWVYFLSMFDVTLEFYIEGPKYTIENGLWWISTILVKKFLLVLGAWLKKTLGGDAYGCTVFPPPIFPTLATALAATKIRYNT